MVILSAAAKNNRFEARILREICERVFKSFMDVINITELPSGTLGGTDVISYINAKFNLLVSSGTVYSLLYSLEQNGQIEELWKERKITHKHNNEGE